MILGLSMFEAVLDRLGKDGADAPLPSSAAWPRIRGLNASFVGPGSVPGSWQDSEQLHAAYSAYSNDVVVPPPEPAIDVSIFKRLGPEDIAQDINVLASDTRAELQLKRRDFARLNHPDRAPEDWREAATTRMKIANRLIDEALRKIDSERP